MPKTWEVNWKSSRPGGLSRLTILTSPFRAVHAPVSCYEIMNDDSVAPMPHSTPTSSKNPSKPPLSRLPPTTNPSHPLPQNLLLPSPHDASRVKLNWPKNPKQCFRPPDVKNHAYCVCSNNERRQTMTKQNRATDKCNCNDNNNTPLYDPLSRKRCWKNFRAVKRRLRMQNTYASISTTSSAKNSAHKGSSRPAKRSSTVSWMGVPSLK